MHFDSLLAAPRTIIYLPFDPIIHLGPIPIHWYGVCYAVAFVVGLSVAVRHVRARGVRVDQAQNLAFWSIILGLISARLYYDFQSGAMHYLTHPLLLLDFPQGGMAYFGAIFVVPIFILLYCRHYHINHWIMLDAAVLFAAAGQPIGRIGNIINGDILGYRSDLPWATAYTNPHTFAPQVGVAYQPAGAYELLLALCILGILLAIRTRFNPRAGALFISYLALYAVSQFGIFFIRANSVTAFGLKQAQISSLVLIMVTGVLLLYWSRQSQSGTAAPPIDPDGSSPPPADTADA